MAQKIDQQQNTGRNDGQSDQLGRGEKLEHSGIVAPQQLVEKAERAVENQIAGHRHAARGPPHQMEVEKGEQQLSARLIQLHRMQRGAGIAERRFAPRRIADAPEEFGRLAVAAAVEEAADPAAGVRQSEGGSADIEDADDIQLLPVRVEPECGDRQQEAAVENQSALIDPDDPPEVILDRIDELEREIQDNMVELRNLLNSD